VRSTLERSLHVESHTIIADDELHLSLTPP
jgi:hypothetical protein